MSLVHPHSPGETRAPLIEAALVNKSFGTAHVLRDVSTRFYQGEVAVIIGASGSGKSTFLRTLNRLEKHDSGRIVEAEPDERRADHLGPALVGR